MNKEKIAQFYSKYKIFIFPISVAIASLVLIVVVIYPQISTFLKNQSDFEDMSKRLQSLEVKAKDLEVLDVDDLNNGLAIAFASLPSDQDLATITGVIQRLATISGVSLASLQVNPGQVISLNGANGFTVKAEISGSKAAVSRFINNIDQSSRLMKISTIEISHSRVGSDLTTALLSVHVFYSPSPKELGPIDSELPQLTSDDQRVIATLAKAKTTVGFTSPTLPKGKSNPFD